MSQSRIKGGPLVGLDLTGATFGSVTVVSYKCKSDKGNVWVCKCVCGATLETTAGRLREGRIVSCGCKYVNPSITHGMTETRIYRVWSVMKSRCNNPNAASYEDYGGRGIRVCDRWNDSFEDFYADMRDGYADHLFIDRKDNDGHYCKENCKWSTRAEQARNKRNNFWYERDGVRMIKMDWATHFGISHNHFNSMLRQGYSFDQVFDFYKDRKRWKIKDQLNDNRKNKLSGSVCDGGVCK